MTHPDTKPEALRLADELREIDRAKRYHPSGPGGQMCGAEQYRLIAPGWTFGKLHDAADKMESLHAECESLRTQLQEQALQSLSTMGQDDATIADLRAQLAEARESFNQMEERFWEVSQMHDHVTTQLNAARAEAEALRADARRWREMRRVFHVTENIGRTNGMPATKLSCHWHGWASGDHADVTGCVDALIAERDNDMGAKEA